MTKNIKAENMKKKKHSREISATFPLCQALSISNADAADFFKGKLWHPLPIPAFTYLINLGYLGYLGYLPWHEHGWEKAGKVGEL